MTFDEHEAFLAQRDRRRFEAFVAGAVGTHITLITIEFFWKHRAVIIKSLVMLYVVLNVISITYIHVFSPQTRDLSDQITAAKARVVLTSVQGDVGPNPNDYWNDKKVKTLSFTVVNGTAARITELWITCKGRVVRQPPDSSYEAKTENTDRYIRVPTRVIGPFETTPIEFSPDDLYSNPENLSCKVDNVAFVEADFYRRAHEMDWRGLAAVDDSMLQSYGTSRPFTYLGNTYTVEIAGEIKNLNKTRRIDRLSFSCVTYHEIDSTDMDTAYGTVPVDIAPGATYDLNAKIESHYSTARANCQISNIGYAS